MTEGWLFSCDNRRDSNPALRFRRYYMFVVTSRALPRFDGITVLFGILNELANVVL
jgi:hypothetical protein